MRTDQLTRAQLEEKAAGYDPPIDVSKCVTKEEVHQTIVRELAARGGVEGLVVVPEPKEPETLEEALNAVLAHLGPIPKNGKAPAGMGGYAFRKFEDITATLKPLFARYGIVGPLPEVLERVDTERPTKNQGVLYCTNLKVDFRFKWLNGEEEHAVVWGEGTDSGDKAVQKAMTSALKTALSVVFLISESEADDAEAHDVPATEPELPADAVPDAEVVQIRDRLKVIVHDTGAYPTEWRKLKLPSVTILDRTLAGEFYLQAETARLAVQLLDEAEEWLASNDDQTAEDPETPL